MKNSIVSILGLFGVLALSGCGENQLDSAAPPSAMERSSAPAQTMESSAEPQVPLTGEFELNGEEPFSMRATETGMNCQGAGPGSPFRAQWIDVATGMNILITGWPPTESGVDYRVDNFQVIQMTPNVRNEARLASASLTVEEVSRQGYSVLYSVQASGTFQEGGTFTASGSCRA